MAEEILLDIAGSTDDRARAVVALQSYSRPRADDNPFIQLHADSLVPAAKVHFFSWPMAIFGRYDVFNIHWIEPLTSGRGRVRTALVWVASAILVLRLRVSRTPVVKTLHNSGSRSGSRNARLPIRWLEKSYDSLTAVDIRMNRSKPEVSRRDYVHVPHGHYGDWYARFETPEVVPGRLLNFGLIRSYKGVDTLVETVRSVPGEHISLHVVGRIVEPPVGEKIRAAASRDPRVSIYSDHASEATLAREIGEASVVVLPYAEFYNSGCALLALTLGRRILVPQCQAAQELRREFGDEWVLVYDSLREGILSALSAAQPLGSPDLRGREWDLSARLTIGAYRTAMSRRGTRLARR